MIEASLAAGLSAAAALFGGAAARMERHEGVVSSLAPAPAAALPASRKLRRIAPWLARLLIGVAGAALGMALAGPPGFVAGAAVGFVVPTLRARRAMARRDQRMEEQLVDAVRAVAAGLRAGRSLTQALGFAAEEAEAPLSTVWQDVVDRTRFGVPLDEALEGWVAGEPTRDALLVVSVLRLHRRTGGDLPTVLDRLARTLQERRAAATDVRSLTAQARLSGAILGLLPIGFFLFLSATSRKEIVAAYHSTTGMAAIGIGLAMQGAAFLWIRRLLRVSP